MDKYTSCISKTERKRGVLQEGSKRLDGDVMVLFRCGSFLSNSTSILFPLDPVKIQSVVGFFFVRLLALKCCYCIYSSFWQSKEMFLPKETMTCMIGLDIGSHIVIPEALTLFWVNKSNGCRPCWRNFIEKNLNSCQIECVSAGRRVFSVLRSTLESKLGAQRFPTGGLRWDCRRVVLMCGCLQSPWKTRMTLSVRVVEKAELSRHWCLCARSPRALSQQGALALCAVPLADLTRGSDKWVSGKKP